MGIINPQKYINMGIGAYENIINMRIEIPYNFVPLG